MSRQSYREDPLFSRAIEKVRGSLKTRNGFDKAKGYHEAILTWYELHKDYPIGVMFSPPVLEDLSYCYKNLMEDDAPKFDTQHLREDIISILETAVAYIEAGQGTVQATARELAQIYQEIGRYNMKGNPEEAAYWFDKSLSLVADPLTENLKRSLRLEKKDAVPSDTQSRIEKYQKLVEQNPGRLRYLIALAQLLKENNRTSELLELWEKVKHAVTENTQKPHNAGTSAQLSAHAVQLGQILFPVLFDANRYQEAEEFCQLLKEWEESNNLQKFTAPSIQGLLNLLQKGKST